MQTVLVATAVIVGVAAFIAFIVWLIRLQIAQQAAADSTWRAYAAKRNLKWIDPSGPWYRGQKYRLVGDIDGVQVTLDQFDVNNGKSSIRYSRAVAELPRAALERLLICRKTFLSRLNFAFQGPILEFDDSSRSQPLHVRCRSEAFARSIANNEFRAALYSLSPRTYVELRDRQAKVWWNGAEPDPAVLDRAVALLVSVVRSAARA